MTHRRRRELFPMFAEDVRIDVLFGDSHADDTYQWAAAATGGDVDFLFIDGDHSYDGVREDFETYRRLVADGGCIAFHDIRRHAEDHREKETRLRRAESLPERYVSVGQQRWQGASTFGAKYATTTLHASSSRTRNRWEQASESSNYKPKPFILIEYSGIK